MKLRYSTKFFIGTASVLSAAAFAFGTYVSQPDPAPPLPQPIPVYIVPANNEAEESPTPSPKPTPSVNPATSGGPISTSSPEAGGNTGGSIVMPTGNTAPLKPPTKGTGK